MSQGTEQMSNPSYNIDNGPKENEVLFRKIYIPEVTADVRFYKNEVKNSLKK